MRSAMRSVLARTLGGLTALASAACAGPAAAHSFGVVYNLPMPFWMYAFAASAALALSFLVVGFLVTSTPGARSAAGGYGWTVEGYAGAALLAGARSVSLFLLALAIAAGLMGPANPFANLAMTMFWILFVLGFAYLTAIAGDLYDFISPWRLVGAAADRLAILGGLPRLRYPGWLGYYPALVLYMGFIYVELFGHAGPRALALLFMGYLVVNTVAAALFGAQAWFRYGEFFGVFLRLIGKISPIAWEVTPAAQSTPTQHLSTPSLTTPSRLGHSQRGQIGALSLPAESLRVRLRPPFVGLLEEEADHFSLILFVLFMLSSTAFDGLHETLPWVTLFWTGVYPALDAALHLPYLVMVNFYYVWQALMLFVSPFVYLAVYLFFIWLMKGITRSDMSVRQLALKFAFSLVPIAVVYHITHYYTLLIDQAQAVVPQLSDPLGMGWNLFGTARQTVQPVILLASSVWHTQVALILVGHIVSVYLAHLGALNVFGKAKRALWSQLPMLVLMMLFTTMGLWILSLPIAAGQVQDPNPAVMPDPSSPNAPGATPPAPQ